MKASEGQELLPCPFCDAVPRLYDAGDYNVDHRPECYLVWIGRPMAQWIVGKRAIVAWNTRTGSSEGRDK